MHRIGGVVQHYAWGDRTFLPGMLGVAADGRPWAELWFGTHPAGAATVDDGRALREVAGELPFLLKVLAAAGPLSMQTHPTAARARAGFAHEEALGIPIEAPERIYRDPHAKPELVVALGEFDALCGFRPVEATIDLLRRHGIEPLAARLAADGLAAVVTDVLRAELDPAQVVEACARARGPEPELVTALAQSYPGDPSAVITLLLNRVVLARGEALFLAPGNLHAYLRGTAVEVMGPSDNVVRGGLTIKHVDADELLIVLDVSPLPDPVLRPGEVEPGRWCYETHATPFTLWRFDVDGAMRHTAGGRELVLCTDGDVGILGAGDAAYLAPGERVAFTGRGTVFRVEETTGS